MVSAVTRTRVEALARDGKFRRAAELLEAERQHDPDNAELLAWLARLWLQAGDPQAALSASTVLVGIDPDSSDAWDIHGRALNNGRRARDALEAFERAVTLEPGSAASWFHYGHVLRGLGRMEPARDAYRRAVDADPTHVRAWRGLAGTCQHLDDNPAAIEALENAARQAPRDAGVRVDLGLARHAGGNLKGALGEFDRALAADPDNAGAHAGRGILCHELRQSAQAETHLKRALSLAPDDPANYAQLAHLYDALNRLDDARTVIADGRRAHPDDPMLRLEAARQNRRTGDIEAGVAQLEPAARGPLPPRLARQVFHELGRLYDRAGRYEEAFHAFNRCNTLARGSDRMRRVSARRFRERIAALDAFFRTATPALLTTQSDYPAAKSPTFLLGFPRSGTTLADVILDSHPRLTSIEERPTLNAVEELLSARPGGYPAALKTLRAADIEPLRERYFAAVHAAATPADGDRILDKLPMRTIHAGLIWRLFPAAKILLALRHPCDVILSNVMQDYALNDMTANFFTLEDAAALYDSVMTLWTLYTERLPFDWCATRYEDMVDDRQAETKRLLDYLGLEPDPAVDDYLATVRRRERIDTTSFDQVSEPVYRRSRLRWHNYRRFLEPVLPRLEAHIERFGYTT